MLSYAFAPSHYFIDLQGIMVGKVRLPIPTSVFSNSRTIIDSGTTVSYLPHVVYTALEKEFAKQMSMYTRAPGVVNLALCYDLSRHRKWTLPVITLVFGGNVMVKLDPAGTVLAIGPSRVCLPFVGYKDPKQLGILGNTQQRTLSVIHDIEGGRLGFSPGGCR
ncbi:hypothetical protein Dimus_033482 [Dionaea muscipula]